jgi:ribonuclease Z
VGRGAIRGVAANKLPIAEIGPLFVSHLHVDPIGELANCLITGHIEGRRRPLKIYGPPGTAGVVDALLGLVDDRDIAFRDGEAGYGRFVGAEVTELRGGQIVEGDGWRARCEEVEHGPRPRLRAGFSGALDLPCLARRARRQDFLL